MYFNFYVPQYFEGFNEIQIIYNTNKIFVLENLEKELDVPQDNPHHTLSISEHCFKTASNLIPQTKPGETLLKAALLHDIGKLDTKTFINTKGEKTDIAHYYQHEYVGAYKSLFYTREDKEQSLEIAKYIQWHMLLFRNLSEKTYLKYEKLLGKVFMGNLKKIHKADSEAK